MPVYLNGLIMIGFVVIVIVYLIVTTKMTLNSLEADVGDYKRGVVIRMIINYIQLLQIVFSFQLSWPSGITNTLSITDKMLDVPSLFLSFQCFVDDKSKLSIPIWGIEIIFMIILPFFGSFVIY